MLSCLLPKLFIVIEMAHFLYFLLMTAKKSVMVWAKYFSASERSYLAVLENAVDYCFLSYHQQDVNPYKYKILVFLLNQDFFLDIFTIIISQMVTLNPIKHHFQKEFNKIFQVHLNILPKL